MLETLYPTRCVACGEETAESQMLCATCWPDVHFISGLVCDACGVPLQGDARPESQFCESCFKSPPAWGKGRAVALYQGSVRRMVLALKHADRLDIAIPMASWMSGAVRGLTEPDSIVTAVPLHRRRFFLRRYNQAVLLGNRLAKNENLQFVPDILIRVKPTLMQKGMTRQQRFENLRGAIAINPRQSAKIQGKPVLIVDDVMTTGATLSACAEACLAGGAKTVNVIVLARVARPE